MNERTGGEQGLNESRTGAEQEQGIHWTAHSMGSVFDTYYMYVQILSAIFFLILIMTMKVFKPFTPYTILGLPIPLPFSWVEAGVTANTGENRTCTNILFHRHCNCLLTCTNDSRNLKDRLVMLNMTGRHTYIIIPTTHHSYCEEWSDIWPWPSEAWMFLLKGTD